MTTSSRSAGVSHSGTRATSFGPPIVRFAKTTTMVVSALMPAVVSSRSAAGAVAVPTAIHVEDRVVDGRALVPYDNVWLVSIRYDDGRRSEIGLSTDHVRYRQIDGKRYLTRVEGTTMVRIKEAMPAIARFSMTFNVFEPSTLLPKSGDEYDSDGLHVHRDFDMQHVVSQTRKRGQSSEEKLTIELPEPVYDFNGGMTGLLLATLPLKLGYRARLPAVDEKAFSLVPLQVAREETIVHAGRSMHTFVVEIGGDPIQSTYWISRMAPYVIKVEVNVPHAVLSWDMPN